MKSSASGPGGGGGWGDPLERASEAVLEDVGAGLVSPERARSVYGVVIRDGQVDANETIACRAVLAAARRELPAFDFGPGRSEWESVYGLAAGAVADWLPELPAGVRRHAQGEVYRVLRASGRGPYDERAVGEALRVVSARLQQNIERKAS